MEENREWVIAFVGGRTVVGALNMIGDPHLSPVYDFHSGPVPAEGGRMGIGTMAMPVLMMPSITRLLCDLDNIVAVAALSAADRAAVMRAVSQAEKMAQEIRASQSGIVVPGAIGKR